MRKNQIEDPTEGERERERERERKGEGSIRSSEGKKEGK